MSRVCGLLVSFLSFITFGVCLLCLFVSLYFLVIFCLVVDRNSHSGHFFFHCIYKWDDLDSDLHLLFEDHRKNILENVNHLVLFLCILHFTSDRHSSFNLLVFDTACFCGTYCSCIGIDFSAFLPVSLTTPPAVSDECSLMLQ